VHVIATAGHVDHGKSTLVRLLTGMEPDRWAEEQRRGMTIDLGYAWTDLPSGERVAFVDVPGHERFVTNMLAGVGPVPAAMLVIAADEGWRAQTEEHAAALAAFGVQHLLLVVTRSDLRDPTAATSEALDRLDRIGPTPTDAVAVSGATGAGKDALVAALDRLVAALPPVPASPTRLWVDRVFTIRGAGVVATGTLQSGDIAVGDTLESTTGESFTVRALESCKQQKTDVTATARVAVNLRGADVQALRRGDCLLAPRSWRSVDDVDVELSAPLPAGELTLHVGSAAVPVRVRPLGTEPTSYARLTLTRPLPLRVRDRGILRHPSGHDAPVGARVLDVNPAPLTRRGDAARRADELAQTRTPMMSDLVRWHDVLTVAEASAMHPMARPLRDYDGGAVRVGSWLVRSDTWNTWQEQLRALTAGDDPLSRGRSRGDLVNTLGLPDETLLDDLLTSVGATPVRGWVRQGAVEQQWDAQVEAALAELEVQLRNAPFRAPEISELDALGINQRIRGIAAEQGRLLRVSRDVYLLPEALELAVTRLASLGENFTVSEARQALDSTRRVVVPLLEFLDGAGRTRRVDATHRTLHRGA
jgi:selenocysteine-specific elongation factor